MAYESRAAIGVRSLTASATSLVSDVHTKSFRLHFLARTSARQVQYDPGRRWNWRQGRRTQLREDTTAALFILDALDPMTSEALEAAADDLVARLAERGPGVRAARRLRAAARPLL
jgi:hypothetical protein